MKTFTCKHCNTNFSRPGCRSAVYCSTKCYHAAHHEGNTIHRKADLGTSVCLHCHTEFKIKRKETYRFCSVACSNRAQAEAQIKRHQGGIRRQHELKKEKMRTGEISIPCSICGWSRFAELVHAVAACRGGKHTHENTTWMCPNHHRLFDRHRFTDEEFEKLTPHFQNAYRERLNIPIRFGPAPKTKP